MLSVRCVSLFSYNLIFYYKMCLQNIAIDRCIIYEKRKARENYSPDFFFSQIYMHSIYIHICNEFICYINKWWMCKCIEKSSIVEEGEVCMQNLLMNKGKLYLSCCNIWVCFFIIINSSQDSAIRIYLRWSISVVRFLLSTTNC